MLRDVSNDPEGVPPDVMEAALEIKAKLSDPAEEALLWRMVNLPEVWELLRRNVKKNGEHYLGRFFSMAFGIACQPHLAVTFKSGDETYRFIEARTSMLLRDHQTLSLCAADTAGSDGPNPASAHFEKMAARSLDLAEDWAAFLKDGPQPLFVKRVRGDQRVLALGLHMVKVCEDHFGQPMYSVAAKIANVALELSGPNRITPDALGKADKRRKRRTGLKIVKTAS